MPEIKLIIMAAMVTNIHIINLEIIVFFKVKTLYPAISSLTEINNLNRFTYNI